jgi:hypothetical protein
MSMQKRNQSAAELYDQFLLLPESERLRFLTFINGAEKPGWALPNEKKIKKIELVCKVLMDRQNGMSIKQVAKKYGISERTVANFRDYKKLFPELDIEIVPNQDGVSLKMGARKNTFA